MPKETVISGVKWSSVSNVGRQIVQFVTTAILAHLLSPMDFGLMGMTMIVIGFVTMLQDLGTSAAVIQRKSFSEDLLSSIFWIQICFGIVVMFTLVAIAPVIAGFFEEPRITPILRVSCLIFVICGLGITQQAMLERNLYFSTLARIEIVATAVGSIIGIALAFLRAGIWSLVGQALSLVTVTSLLLWVVNPWRPRFIFSWRDLKSVSTYSFNLTGFNIFNFLIRNLDSFLIGKYLGTQQLGYYSMAYRLMFYPVQNIAAVIGRVMFPVYSQMQDDDAQFRRTFLGVTAAIALISFPLMLGLMATSEPFILSIFGSKWTPVIVLLMIIAPIGLIQSIGTTVGCIYLAKGRTDWMLRWGVFSGLVIISAFIIGLRWGIIGVASAYAVATLILLVPSFAIPFHLINLHFLDLANLLWRPFASSLLMFGVVLIVRESLPHGLSSGLTLAILVSVGIVAYLLASWILNRTQIQQVLEQVGVKI